MNAKTIIFVILFLSLSLLAKSQGCSDAGFCTINSFKPTADDSLQSGKNNSFKIGISTGQADYSISVLSPFLEYSRQINSSTSIDAKLTAMNQSGNGITASGVSDVYLNVNHALSSAFRITVGIKLPLTDGNKLKNGLPLPMDYQSSLGTVDAIFGIGYSFQKLKFIIAFQQPLSQNNNQFIAENYPSASALHNFQSTNEFKRSGDVLFRASYPFRINHKINLLTSLLPIYHFKNDTYKSMTGSEAEIKGSQGLTLNGNVYLEYQFQQAHSVNISIGAPFIVRDTRPDGLTRSFVLGLEYKVEF